MFISNHRFESFVSSSSSEFTAINLEEEEEEKTKL
jgi:hypothetical protein